jgi:alpha-tubulin suppressor-like RCC1 family protein
VKPRTPGAERSVGLRLGLASILAGTGCAALARGPGWESVAVGDAHACAIREQRLYCWGENEVGALGIGAGRGHRYTLIAYPVRRYPARVAGRGWSSVRANEESTCGIRRGRLYCWGDGSLLETLLADEREGGVGDNQHGQLGDGTTEPRRQPQRVGNGDGWTDVTAAEDITCGIQDGALYCWGVTATRYSPQSKQVSPPLFTPTPRLADPQRDWIAVETSPTLVCGLRSGGRLACREHAFFRVGVDGKPLKPAELEPTPFAPPGTRRYGF